MRSGQFAKFPKVNQMTDNELHISRNGWRLGRLRLLRVLLPVLLGLSMISCSARDEAEPRPSLFYTNIAPDKGDKQWLIYEDDAVKMVAVGYGDATKQSMPGFFVYRKATADWIRVDRVSTRGATFGRSPTLDETRDAGKAPASIGWNFRSLEEADYVDLPLTSAGFLFFPDKVELDHANKEYVLRFNSGWDIEGVETILRLSVDALREKNLAQSRGGQTPRTTSEK